jgi:hypothetical protein
MLARNTVFDLCAFLAISIQAGSVGAQPMASEQEDAQRVGDLVIANHILADQNILDAWGPCQHSLGRQPEALLSVALSRARAGQAGRHHGI